MAITKGRGQKFSKRRTDISTPQIARPEISVNSGTWVGSAEIDEFNPENLYFHIFGGVPDQSILYIYGERFNQNFYSELAQHDHGPGTLATGNVSGGTTSHNHSGSVSLGSHSHGGSSGSSGGHTHSIYAESHPTDGDAAQEDEIIDTIDSGNRGYVTQNKFGTDYIGDVGNHSHSVSVNSTNLGSPGLSINSTSINSHSHTVTGGVTGGRGNAPAAGPVRTGGGAKTYFDGMLIAIDGIDRTATLLAQASLAKFGDGTAGHAIVTTGVELDITAFVAAPGQHKITFSLPGGAVDNGGKVRYNLYTLAQN